MNDTILKRFNEWNDRIRIARQDWDKAEKEYHNVCYESRQLRGGSGGGRSTSKIIKFLLKDDAIKLREKELLKIDLNTSLTQELWSSTATIIVRATNDGFISCIKQWTITNMKQTEQRNNNNDNNDNNEITKSKLMINQWDTITEKIDAIAESIAIDVQKRQNNDKIKVRKLDRVQETRKHFEYKEKENKCTGNKRRKLLPQQPSPTPNTTATTTAKTPLYRRSRKEVGALHARNECLAAMELHEAMRTVLSTLKIQQSNLLICRAVNRAFGSCCERLRSQQHRCRRRLRRRIVRQQQQLRILDDVGRHRRRRRDDNDNDNNENENENENNDNNEDNNININNNNNNNNGENENNAVDVDNNNNIDENEDTINSSGNDNADNNNGDNDNDDAEEQQKIDEEWNRKVEVAKVDSLYQWYRKNVGLL